MSFTSITHDSPEWRVARDRLDARSIPVPWSGCQVWLGACCSSGYGSMNFRGKIWSTHRLSYTVHRGLIPSGLDVLHKCDVRPCINPDHFFLGDDAANMADKVAKGRQAKLRGMEQGRAKLSDDQVIAILRDPRTHKEIAADYGISTGPVMQIKSGGQWTHVTDGQTDRRGNVNGIDIGNSKLNDEAIRLILSDNRAQWRIAKDFGVCQMTISLIKQRKIWRHVSQ